MASSSGVWHNSLKFKPRNMINCLQKHLLRTICQLRQHSPMDTSSQEEFIHEVEEEIVPMYFTSRNKSFPDGPKTVLFQNFVEWNPGWDSFALSWIVTIFHATIIFVYHFAKLFRCLWVIGRYLHGLVLASRWPRVLRRVPEALAHLSHSWLLP